LQDVKFGEQFDVLHAVDIGKIHIYVGAAIKER
jgi:hypothetical protein